MKIAFVCLFVISLVSSCKTLKNVSCVSSRTIPVTFITNTGSMYTINVPFCDTVRLNDNKPMTDSVQAVLQKK